MDKRVSPLKDRPLRQAGQSVQEQINDFIDEKFINYGMLAVFMVALTIYEWTRWFLKSPQNPYLISLLTGGVFLYCLYKLFSARKQLKNLRLGRDGEKEVAEILEELRSDGNIVFHDIVGKKFNLDHVVLSPKGIYVIETKTWSKPKGNEAKVHYDGTHLTVDSIGNKDEILVQVDAEITWLKNMLKESTGREFAIKPVVVFPGWYVKSEYHNKYWILNPKGLPKFIQSQKEILSKEDVKLAAYHLSRYIRAL